MAARTPADIARETLKLLASRRIAPTPANYQAIYEEVAGVLPQEPFPQRTLRRIGSLLPQQTALQTRIASSFSEAVETQDWTALQAAIVDYARLDLGLAPQTLPPATPPVDPVSVLPHSVAESLARVLQSTLSVLGDEDQRMQALTEQLVQFLQVGPPPLPALEQMLHNYSYRLSFTAEDQAQRREAIHALLRMVCSHIAAIATQDQTLQQHAQSLTEHMQQPWTLKQLDHIHSDLKNLLFRHLELEGYRDDMQEQLKELLAQHAQQMARLGHLSEHHVQTLQACASQISATQDLGDLATTLQTVVQSGSALVSENRQVQAQLQDLREQTLAQEQAIAQMSSHIHALSQSTRHDTDTGALNLDGLHETLHSETARVQRQRHPHSTTISLAALEIDQLSNLPPPVGHAALTHLARLARNQLRPQDALGRVTAQGFVVVFPGTEPAHAAQALARLQQQLQQQPLRHEDSKYPLSFSAGVIAAPAQASPSEAFTLAAQACAQAQRMGAARIHTP